ncbi:hypothetical protein P4S64_12060 [Vibrio sp. M60_M31a]
MSEIQLPIDIACHRSHFSKEQESIIIQHIEQCIESADDTVARIE